MVCLFAKDATNFSTNGLKVLQPAACTVTEEINGDYSLELVMPQGDATVQPEMIIRAPTPRGDQLFRVYKPKVDMAGNNVYQCRHIFYDLLDDFIEDTRPTGNGQAAISAVLSGTGFTGFSDISTQNSAEYQMMNPVKAILGGNDSDDNAFINRWGGEIERDDFTVRMLSRLGADRGVSIRYRKNLTGLTLETDMSGVVTRIYPTGRAADGQTLLKLPEKYVNSPLLGSYARPKTARHDYEKIQVVDKTDDSHPNIVTEAQALDQLRAAAVTEFAVGADKPTFSADVEFVPLETTEEYKNDGLAGLEKVYLGDTVHVIHEPLGLALTARVVSYEYDCLTQRYSKVTLGSVQECVGSIRSTIGQIATVAQETANSAQTSANDAQHSADVAKGQITVVSGKVDAVNGRVDIVTGKIGDVEDQISATEKGLESKVSKDDLSSDIEQLPDAVVEAFNNKDGSTQQIKFTGNGFDFFYNGTLLGHMGVAYDAELGGYEFCIQPVNGAGTYFANKYGYSMICMGALKATSLAADGLISTSGYFQGVYKTHNGSVGKTETLPIMMADGSKQTLEFQDGLYVARD